MDLMFVWRKKCNTDHQLTRRNKGMLYEALVGIDATK